MDLASILGLVVAFGAVLGGFALEGGHMKSIMQFTAFIIVFFGTVGAVMLQFPGAHLIKALKGIAIVFKPPHTDLPALVKQMVAFADKARKEGVVALESEAEGVKEPFLKKALGLAVDGSESRIVRDAMEVEMQIAGEDGEAGAKVFEAMGGYAPTVGILGAVLGLIHVMENLADPSKLGSGIAVAFVATVYGVAIANLIMLPIAGKLKVRNQHEMIKYELIIAGVCGIIDGENPRLIETKLMGFCGEEHSGQAAKKAA